MLYSVPASRNPAHHLVRNLYFCFINQLRLQAGRATISSLYSVVDHDTMRFSLITIILLTITLASCGDTNRRTAPGADNTVRDTTATFQYRDILEDYMDSLPSKDIRGLFGTWTITSIAKAGTGLQSEELIRGQIGHKLFFDSNSLTFDILDKSIRVERPVYSVKYIKNDRSLKGTTLFEGYLPCRKSVVMLDISEKLYIEVIHFQQMAYFCEGRIYFLTHQE
jgi:hypothetical protein